MTCALRLVRCWCPRDSKSRKPCWNACETLLLQSFKKEFASWARLSTVHNHPHLVFLSGRKQLSCNILERFELECVPGRIQEEHGCLRQGSRPLLAIIDDLQ